MAALTSLLHRIAILCRKELLALLKDPMSRLILVGPVVAQAIMFGYGATYDLNHVPYALLNQSAGPASAELVARFDGSGFFEGVATLRSTEGIAQAVDSGDVLLVVHIGPQFDSQLAAGQPAPIQLILDGHNSTTAGMAAGHIGALVGEFNAAYATRAAVAAPATVLAQREAGTATVTAVAPREASAAAFTAVPQIELSTRAWFNPNLESRWNIMTGLIATLSMLQTLLVASLSVAREREQGTFDQLLVTPLGPLEILLGKALPAILVGLVQSSLILLISLYWFRIPMAGSLFTLYLGLLVFTTASVGIGLGISALSANMQQAMVYAFVLLVPMILLSGFVTPVGTMPDILQAATWANPLRFALDLVRRVYLEGAILSDVTTDLLAMVVVAAVTLPMAAWLFRNRLT